MGDGSVDLCLYYPPFCEPLKHCTAPTTEVRRDRHYRANQSSHGHTKSIPGTQKLEDQKLNTRRSRFGGPSCNLRTLAADESNDSYHVNLPTHAVLAALRHRRTSTLSTMSSQLGIGGCARDLEAASPLLRGVRRQTASVCSATDALRIPASLARAQLRAEASDCRNGARISSQFACIVRYHSSTRWPRPPTPIDPQRA